jgi:hypothetical protein
MMHQSRVVALLNDCLEVAKAIEVRAVENYLNSSSKAYARRTPNWCVVRDILMQGTSKAGMTSSISKCRELGIDPYGYNLKPERDETMEYAESKEFELISD